MNTEKDIAKALFYKVTLPKFGRQWNTSPEIISIHKVNKERCEGIAFDYCLQTDILKEKHLVFMPMSRHYLERQSYIFHTTDLKVAKREIEQYYNWWDCFFTKNNIEDYHTYKVYTDKVNDKWSKVFSAN